MASQHDIINSQHDSKAEAQRVLNVDENGAKFTPATEETLQSMADPLAKYKDAGMDVASNPMYFGYIALDGSWYIKKLDTTSGTTYVKGDVDYETNWINRASLTYELFNEVF